MRSSRKRGEEQRREEEKPTRLTLHFDWRCGEAAAGARDPVSYAIGQASKLIYSSTPRCAGLGSANSFLPSILSAKMPPKKASKPEKPEIPIQPVPEKRGYEFGGPYVSGPIPGSRGLY